MLCQSAQQGERGEGRRRQNQKVATGLTEGIRDETRHHEHDREKADDVQEWVSRPTARQPPAEEEGVAVRGCADIEGDVASGDAEVFALRQVDTPFSIQRPRERDVGDVSVADCLFNLSIKVEAGRVEVVDHRLPVGDDLHFKLLEFVLIEKGLRIDPHLGGKEWKTFVSARLQPKLTFRGTDEQVFTWF